MRSVFQLVVGVTATSALLAAVSCSDDKEKSQGDSYDKEESQCDSYDVAFKAACNVYCDHVMELSCWTADVSRDQCLAVCEKELFGVRDRGALYACIQELTALLDACPYVCEKWGGREVPGLSEEIEMCSEARTAEDCVISHRDCEMCEKWGDETHCTSVNCEDCLAWPGRYSCRRLDCEICDEADAGVEYCQPVDCGQCRDLPPRYSCHER